MPRAASSSLVICAFSRCCCVKRARKTNRIASGKQYQQTSQPAPNEDPWPAIMLISADANAPTTNRPGVSGSHARLPNVRRPSTTMPSKSRPMAMKATIWITPPARSLPMVGGSTPRPSSAAAIRYAANSPENTYVQRRHRSFGICSRYITAIGADDPAAQPHREYKR